MASYLNLPNRAFINSCFTPREGETKLGQTLVLPGSADLAAEVGKHESPFVLLGIPEDIGIRANYGKPGAAGFWQAFLPALLNVQDNVFLSGAQVMLAGNVDCSDLVARAEGVTDTAILSELTAGVDARAEEILFTIFKAGGIPIVIGGGHNNAYPIIRAASRAFAQSLNIINIDPHADLRHASRRHSGNGFSYALKEDLLNMYFQVGLHESYNNSYILDQYERNISLMHQWSFDDYLEDKWTMIDLEKNIRDMFTNHLTGLELDADSIENMPSSAQTPTGFSANDARRMVKMISYAIEPAYFHLPEAIPATEPINSMKLAAYLVCDFIKGRINAGRDKLLI